jgi:protein-S-isoprenylcysteine O-methyltransferase Ste14
MVVRSGEHSGARRAVGMLVSPVLWVFALFAGAGRLDWTRGWVCVGLYVIGMSLVGLVVHRVNAPVMEARATWRKQGTKRFDTVFLGLLLPLVFIQVLVAGMDVVRYGWSALPAGLAYVGGVLFALSLALIAWTMSVNKFAESSVRIQEERGHSVVSSGPYRVVRHPMYVGAILMYVATPLILGSLWALAITALMTALFLWRTAMEDQTLRRELAGYEEYASRTTYRLIPGVW